VLALIYVIFGGWLGFALAAILCAAGRADERMERLEAQHTRPEDLELEEFMNEGKEAGSSPARR